LLIARLELLVLNDRRALDILGVELAANGSEDCWQTQVSGNDVLQRQHFATALSCHGFIWPISVAFMHTRSE
jgi:hypothetical protein